ncbi:hypothetical protein PM082_000228 [Marasmius tenuissimus]|nr:hypothetical protein PM082_000228 [Marasmius tenuissimus]
MEGKPTAAVLHQGNEIDIDTRREEYRGLGLWRMFIEKDAKYRATTTRPESLKSPRRQASFMVLRCFFRDMISIAVAPVGLSVLGHVVPVLFRLIIRRVGMLVMGWCDAGSRVLHARVGTYCTVMNFDFGVLMDLDTSLTCRAAPFLDAENWTFSALCLAQSLLDMMPAILPHRVSRCALEAGNWIHSTPRVIDSV